MTVLASKIDRDSIGIDTFERAILYAAMLLRKATNSVNTPSGIFQNAIRIAINPTNGGVNNIDPRILINAKFKYNNQISLGNNFNLIDAILPFGNIDPNPMVTTCVATPANQLVIYDDPINVINLERYFVWCASTLTAGLYTQNPRDLTSCTFKFLEESLLDGYPTIEISVALKFDYIAWLCDSNLICSLYQMISDSCPATLNTPNVPPSPYLYGVKWYTGVGAPNNAIGKEDDFYLEDDGDIWIKNSTVWVQSSTNIKGEPGTLINNTGIIFTQGLASPPNTGAGQYALFYSTVNNSFTYRLPNNGTSFSLNGLNGSRWFDSVGVPNNAIGIDGDYNLEDNGTVYEKVAGAWVDTGINLKGADGNSLGATIYYGNAPVSGEPVTAIEDDLWFNFFDGEIYRYDGGSWNLNGKFIPDNVSGRGEDIGRCRFLFGDSLIAAQFATPTELSSFNIEFPNTFGFSFRDDGLYIQTYKVLGSRLAAIGDVDTSTFTDPDVISTANQVNEILDVLRIHGFIHE